MLMEEISKYIIVIFYSDKYLEAVKLLQIFSLAFGFSFFVDVLGFPLLGAFGYVRETNACYITGGLYNLAGIVILFLLNQINIYTIAVLVTTTYVVMFVHRLYYINKYKILKRGK